MNKQHQSEPVAFEERVCSIATDIQGIRRLLEDLANKRWPDKDHDLTGGYVSANIGHASAGAKYHLPALERALLGLNELLHMQADPGEVERDERAEFEKRFGPGTWGHIDYTAEQIGWKCRAALERPTSNRRLRENTNARP